MTLVHLESSSPCRRVMRSFGLPAARQVLIGGGAMRRPGLSTPRRPFVRVSFVLHARRGSSGSSLFSFSFLSFLSPIFVQFLLSSAVLSNFFSFLRSLLPSLIISTVFVSFHSFLHSFSSVSLCYSFQLSFSFPSPFYSFSSFVIWFSYHPSFTLLFIPAYIFLSLSCSDFHHLYSLHF